MNNNYLKYYNNKLVLGSKKIIPSKDRSKIIINVISCGICGSDIIF